MAGNQNSLSDVELDQAIERYKQDLADGKFPRASWPHFCASLGCTEAEAKEVIRQGDEQGRGGAYYGRSQALKRMATWIRGQMLSGSGWGGPMQSKAIFALKQDIGDGVRYTDQDKGTGQIDVKIDFGGGDSRSRKAAK